MSKALVRLKRKLIRINGNGINTVQRALLCLGVDSYLGTNQRRVSTWLRGRQSKRQPRRGKLRGSGQFWQRPVSVHLETLELAEKGYRERIKKCNGNGEKAIMLNHSIRLVRKSFASHGHKLE